VHVFDAAEITVKGGGEDDDGDVRAAAAQDCGDFSAKLAGAEVIVEDGYVDVVEEFGGFFNGGGGDALVTVLAKNGGAKMEVGRFVVEQKDPYGGRTVGHTTARVGRLDRHGT
jgi:hypothetical protein